MKLYLTFGKLKVVLFLHRHDHSPLKSTIVFIILFGTASKKGEEGEFMNQHFNFGCELILLSGKFRIRLELINRPSKSLTIELYFTRVMGKYQPLFLYKELRVFFNRRGYYKYTLYSTILRTKVNKSIDRLYKEERLILTTKLL